MATKDLGLLVAVAVPLASFAIGLRAKEPFWIWKHPGLLARSLLVVLVAVPLLAVLLVELAFPDNAAVRAGIIIAVLSVGMGPPAVLQRTTDPHEAVRYEVGLNIELMLLAIAFVPGAVALHGALLHHETLPLSWESVARLVLLKAVLPVLAGVAFARWWPRTAAVLARHVPKFVAVVMGIVVIAALVVGFPSLLRLSPATWLACLALGVASMSIGHFMLASDRNLRGVLAEFSVLRFPALALLLTSATPNRHELLPVVVAYVLTSFLLVAVYRAVTRRTKA